jgi:hypothetical protein
VLVCVRSDAGQRPGSRDALHRRQAAQGTDGSSLALATIGQETRWRRRGRSGPTAVLVAPHAQPVPPLPRHIIRPRSRAIHALWLLLAGAVCGALVYVAERADDSAFARRVAAGCEELAPCRTLEAEAERRMATCAFFCGGVAAEYREVRGLLHRAEERQAVREHYRERNRTEREARERINAQKLDEWQRRKAASAESAAREREERLELERLRQAHFDRRLLEERTRRARYFASLGAEGREKRLKRCLKSADSCDALALELVESAADDAEKRALGDLNEGVTPPALPPASTRKQKLEASGLDAESAKPLGETPDEATRAPEASSGALETSPPSS